jgi:hypothetical protein
VAPLIGLKHSAPYLHNGSVPTLADLLLPPEQRPAQFPLGPKAQGYTFDTTIPGNRNSGHNFGLNLSPRQRRALVHYLEILPR